MKGVAMHFSQNIDMGTTNPIYSYNYNRAVHIRARAGSLLLAFPPPKTTRWLLPLGGIMILGYSIMYIDVAELEILKGFL